jgi:hypothetical protein
LARRPGRPAAQGIYKRGPWYPRAGWKLKVPPGTEERNLRLSALEFPNPGTIFKLRIVLSLQKNPEPTDTQGFFNKFRTFGRLAV